MIRNDWQIERRVALWVRSDFVDQQVKLGNSIHGPQMTRILHFVLIVSESWYILFIIRYSYPIQVENG